jgi:hypothetical protein
MQTKGVKFMVSILRRAVALVALAVGIGVAAGTAPAAAATAHPTHSTSTSKHALHQPGRVFTFQDWWFE